MFMNLFKTSVILMLVLLMSSLNYAAGNATISGTITDANTGDPLPSTNILLIGTGLGAATDMNGQYTIKNVPAGKYIMRISYLGYKEQKTDIEVKDGQHLEQNFSLEPASLEGQTVVVTGQAAGQNAAINQQLNSDKIINVVSAARIQELPDANAAESVGRLPGVSVLRSGGEGDQVVIRGLEPKFNQITINGVKLSSSDPNNRSTDLSMISSDMLEGIQVAKTVTPDMDANVIGGVVNFELRDAKAQNSGTARYSFTAQSGYNGLENALDKYKNYKLVGTFENRYFDNSFGLLVQGSYERRNLSSNEQGATYGPYGNDVSQYLTNGITLDDVLRDRQRGNAVVSLDYILPDGGTLQFSNLFSTSTTKSNDRQQFYNVINGANTQNFNFLYSEGKLNTITNMLKFEDPVSIFNMKLTLSHSYSETKDPGDWQVNFQNASAGIGAYGSRTNLDPKTVVAAANNDASNTLLQSVQTTYSFTRERVLSAALDFDTPLNISKDVTAVIRFGGKYQHTNRSYDQNVYSGEVFTLASSTAIIEQLQNQFPWFRHRQGQPNDVPVAPFLDPSFNYGTFLNGDYTLRYPLNITRLGSMVDFMNSHMLPNNTTYNYNVGASTRNDYTGTEDVAAFYAMAVLNVGPSLQIIPGARYQQLKTVYTAAQGIQSPTSFSDYPYKLKTVTSYHPRWFPDLLVHYKPADWLGVRLAYTNTISYPDYSAIAPLINVYVANGMIIYNGFELKPVTSTNYDASLSFHNNTIGLFTIGGFLKKIKNVIYQYAFFPATKKDLISYYPDWVQNPNPPTGIQVSKYVNNPYTANDYGMELEWQTHFWYLPEALSGLVLSVNYTHIFSKAEYPDQVTVKNGRFVTHIDTLYFAPLLYQPDNIINLTLGYDYKDFSIRVSSIFSSKIFTQPLIWPQLRTYTDSYNRWDISMKQKLPLMNGIEVYCNLNNITGADDVSTISASTGAPSRQQSYSYMIQLGLRGNF